MLYATQYLRTPAAYIPQVAQHTAVKQTMNCVHQALACTSYSFFQAGSLPYFVQGKGRYTFADDVNQIDWCHSKRVSFTPLTTGTINETLRHSAIALHVWGILCCTRGSLPHNGKGRRQYIKRPLRLSKSFYLIKRPLVYSWGVNKQKRPLRR